MNVFTMPTGEKMRACKASLYDCPVIFSTTFPRMRQLVFDQLKSVPGVKSDGPFFTYRNASNGVYARDGSARISPCNGEIR